MTANPELHVWPIWLTASPGAAEIYRALLSPDERARAKRFVFDRHRENFELSQGALRILLSKYINLAPQKITFSLGARGKPAVAGLGFNKSHSAQLALFAIGTGGEIGVDVEALRELPDASSISERYFCPSEAHELLSLTNPAARQAAFFRCWTRKEAYMKATGDGFYISLNEFQVTLLPEHPARFVHIGNNYEVASQWTLHHLDPVAGYVGALAYAGPPRTLHMRQPMDCGALLHFAW